MPNEHWKLCFATAHFAWFTQGRIADVTGDDWDDAPHDCNASEPLRGGPFLKVAFDGDAGLVVGWSDKHGSAYWGSYWVSADDCNAGRAPWLIAGPKPDSPQVRGGASLAEFSEFIENAGGRVYYGPPAVGKHERRRNDCE